MKNKRICSMTLFCALVASLIGSTACGSDTNATNDTTAPDSDVTTVEESPFEADSLPNDLDFGGKTVSILWWAENNEFCEEQTGDVIDDALYKRDLNVETRLNVKINNIGMSYTWNTRNEYLGAIRSSVMSGDNTYDMATGQYATLPSLITDGIFLNLADLPYLDFSKPWWIQSLLEETTINGKLFTATGSMTRQTIGNICCMFANKRLFSEYNLESPVDIVKRGDWTLDTISTLIKDTYQDLDNDGKQSLGDQYGFVLYNPNAVTAFQQSCELTVTSIDNDGIPHIALNNEHTVNVIEKLYSLFFETQEALYGTETDVKAQYQIFIDGRALITTGFFKQTAAEYKDMADDYWILPYPKFDKEQEEYHTRIGEANTLIGITASTKDPKMVAAVMEAMSSESYRTVDPAYYEIALKVKYSRTDETSQMYDLIRNGVVYDFGSLYGGAINMPFNNCKHYITKSTNWASYYETNKEKAEAAIQTFVDAVKALD